MNNETYQIETGIPFTGSIFGLSKPIMEDENPTALIDRLMAKIDTEKFYSCDDIVSITGASRRTVWNQIKAGQIPATRFGRSYLIPGASIISLLDRLGRGMARPQRD